MAIVRLPSRAVALVTPEIGDDPQPAGFTTRPGNGNGNRGRRRGNGNGNGNGNTMDANAAYLIARTLKSGNINQGYAQCEVDTLSLLVEQGKCSPERIQCRQAVMLRSTAQAVGATVNLTITPVGPAFLRELVVTLITPTVALERASFVITQFAAKGRIALTGTVASTGAGNQPAGLPIGAFGLNVQNYVVPSGIVFDTQNPLVVSLLNLGPGPGTADAEMMATYDEIRMG